MKSLFLFAAPLAMAAFMFAGCDEVTEPGGPGVRPGDQEDREEATFTLSLPDVSVTQGESAEATISIDAGEEFNQQVMVTLTGPQGVSINPQEFELSKDHAERTVVFQAALTAIKGEHMIEVVGKPATGTQTTGEITLTVEEAEEDDGTLEPNDGDLDRPLEPALPLEPAPQPDSGIE